MSSTETEQGTNGSGSGSGLVERVERAVIKSVDMPDEMQHAAVETSSSAFQQYNVEKDIAMYIKKEFDRQYGTTWHCVVGKNFGSFVTHETKNFIYFYLGQFAVLLWKTS